MANSKIFEEKLPLYDVTGPIPEVFFALDHQKFDKFTYRNDSYVL